LTIIQDDAKDHRKLVFNDECKKSNLFATKNMLSTEGYDALAVIRLSKALLDAIWILWLVNKLSIKSNKSTTKSNYLYLLNVW
jgi:hypothetical protein